MAFKKRAGGGAERRRRTRIAEAARRLTHHSGGPAQADRPAEVTDPDTTRDSASETAASPKH